MSNPTISAHDPIPSVRQRCTVSLRADIPAAGEVGAVAVPVVGGGDPPPELGVDALALTSAGFTGARGQTLVLPHPDGVVRVAVGLGTAGTVDATLVRDVAAEFARAVPQHKVLSVEIPPADAGISVAEFAQAVTEGVILARWTVPGRGGQGRACSRRPGPRRSRGRPGGGARGRAPRAGHRRRVQPRP